MKESKGSAGLQGMLNRRLFGKKAKKAHEKSESKKEEAKENDKD